MASQDHSRMMFSGGPVFRDATPSVVMDALRTRKLEDYTVSASELVVAHDEGRMVVRYKNGQTRQWPMRRSFFAKLCNWHRLPAETIGRMDPPVIEALLNNALRIIGRDISVRIEDGEALTITSLKYTRLDDLDLIEESREMGISKVDRDDQLIRLHTETRHETKPVVDDVCGIGMEIVNSETGFAALRSSAYILRYVCSNGATAPLRMGDSGKLYHYGLSPSALREHVRSSARRLPAMFRFLGDCLARAPRQRMPDPVPLRRSMERQLGADVAYQLMRGMPAAGSLYDVFNHITHGAKELDLLKQTRAEEFAFSLLAPNPRPSLGSLSPPADAVDARDSSPPAGAWV